MSEFDQIFADWGAQGIKRVRFEMPDLHGTSRAKIVPLAAAPDFARDGLNMYGGTAVLDTRSDVVPGSLYNEEVGYGDQLLFPDPSTAAVVPWAPGTARFICDAQWYDGSVPEAAPRAVYRRVLEKAAGMGYEPVMGCEFEFYLLDGETRERLFEGYQIFNVVRNEWVPTINRIVDLMPDAGVDIITSNCEYAGSQWEINFTPGRGLAGPDKAFTFKNGVKQIAYQDGYIASFMTKPFAGHSGNGSHIHMSLVEKDTGRNVMGDLSHDQKLSETGLGFVAGVLEHANAIDSLLCPTINCRRRRRVHTFSPTNISWGLEDRSALLRIKAPGLSSTRVETRSPSALMNPYLANAAILAAGLDGIERGLAPGQPPSRRGEPAEEDGSLEKLPATLGEALDHFEASEAMARFFGQEFKDALLAVRRYELARYAAEENPDPDSQRTDEISAWETNEYLELF